MPASSLPRTARFLGSAAALYALVAVIDLLAHPASASRLRGPGDRLFETLLVPYALLTLAAVWELHRGHQDGDGRLGRVGARLAAAGLVAFVAPAIATQVTGRTEALGPIYFLAELVSVVGVVMVGVAVHRARLLPAPVGPLVAVGWLLASPVAEHVTGIALAGAAAFAAAAALVARAPREARTAHRDPATGAPTPAR